jgi:hypothetical protein
MSITGIVYNKVLWHFFRGYNEVTNMLVVPVVGLLVVLNMGVGGAVWLHRRWHKRKGVSPIVVAFLLAGLVTLCSPLFAPSIGQFANRQLWITTPLVEAARYGDAAVVIALLNNGADPNEKQTALGTTALHYMAANGETDAVELLLRRGAEPNARADNSFETPLHWAVEARTNPKTIRMLVKYGSTPTLTDWNGETPINYTEIIPEPKKSEIRRAMNVETAEEWQEFET